MRRTTLSLLSLFLLIALPRSATAVELYRKDDVGLTLRGYYKSLLVFSETLNRPSGYVSNLNRLRLDFDLEVSERLTGKFIYDNEAVWGDYLRTNEFEFMKDIETPTLWDLDHVVLDNPDLFWRHLIYRAYLKYETERAAVSVGRQRIAWGTGRFWNPTDLFNPISPLVIERAERVGADAVNMDISFGALSSVNLVYAARDTFDESSSAVRYRTTIRDYDVSLIAGRFQEDEVVGLDFSGYIGSAGFRGEATYSSKEEGRDYARCVLSYDYTFSNSLYILLEYYYNGQGTDGDVLLDLSQLAFGDGLSTLKKNFLGLNLGYDITPLLRWETYAVCDLDGQSAFLSPEIRYSARTDVDLVAGAQFFEGDSSSEFGYLPDVFYLQLQIFF